MDEWINEKYIPSVSHKPSLSGTGGLFVNGLELGGH